MKVILVDWTMQEAQKLIGEPESSPRDDAVNKTLEVLVEVISSPSNRTKPVGLTVGERELNAA